jgi:hypothetical protein
LSPGADHFGFRGASSPLSVASLLAGRKDASNGPMIFAPVYGPDL